MTTRNRYADKIYAENPTIMWALDDTNQYALAYGSSYKADHGTYTSGKYSNFGLPMVYGATNITTLYENSGSYSLKLPALGFLTKDGAKRTKTVEFWLKISGTQHYPLRVFGHIMSTDGLYLDGGSLSLKIGDYIQSHFVGSAERPMLIHIVYSPTSAVLMVNGEQVIDMKLDQSKLSFPDVAAADDYVGFYAYPTMSRVQVDCVAYYAYAMSAKKASTHFVWGQSVESPEINNSDYTDVPIIADFHAAKNANNFNYPGTGRWQNGIFENISTTSDTLSAPEYSLPTIRTKEEVDISSWYSANKVNNGTISQTLVDGTLINNDVFFEMNPSVAVISGEARKRFTAGSYGMFNSLNVLMEDTKSFYMVAELKTFTYDNDSGDTGFVETKLNDEILFRIQNTFGEYLEAKISYPEISAQDQVATIKYSFNGTDLQTKTVAKDTKFTVGLNFAVYGENSNNPQLISFLSDRASLKMFFGGLPTFEKTFSGRFYKIGFMNEKCLSKYSSYYSSDGTTSSSKTSELLSLISSYTLFADGMYNSYNLDIAIRGSWYDNIPGKLLAKEKKLANGQKAYTFDYLQLNIDYPKMSNLSNANLRSYIRFEDTTSATSSLTDVSQTNKLITATTGSSGKRYEFTDYTIAKAPTDISIDNLEIFLHIDFVIPAIIKKPLSIKRMNISSHVFDEDPLQTKTPIGTKLGKDIYPYSSTNGAITAYDGGEPVMLYKENSPYLYLTRNSGVCLLAEGSKDYGIEIPINNNLQSFYRISLIQFAFYADIDDFPSTTTDKVEVLRIYVGDSKYMTLKVSGGSGNKTTFTLYDSTDALIPSDGIANLYVNGSSSSLRFKSREWHMIGISIKDQIDFSGKSGSIRITGPYLINNISDFQVSQLRATQNYTYDAWSLLDPNPATTGELGEFKWGDIDIEKQWEQVLNPVKAAVTVDSVSINPTEMYNTYLGANMITNLASPYQTDVLNTTLKLEANNYEFYSRYVWSTISVTPV